MSARRATEIARLCLRIEEACRRRDGHEMSAAYAALSLAFLRVKALVEHPGGSLAGPEPAPPY